MLEVTGRYRYPPPNPDWLQRWTEEVLEPDLPIIDAHHHLWEEVPPYLVDEILADLGTGHRVDATISVQCFYGHLTSGPELLRPAGETRRLAVLANATAGRTATRLCAGIVGFADLRHGAAVEELLDAHAAAAGDRFVGVRHGAARDSHFPDGIVLRPAPAGMMAEPSFREGLDQVAARGLTFDAMIYHRQLGELAALARAAPDASIVLDHIGCPLGVGPYEGRRDEVFADWARGLREVARCPNVSVKFGGLGMIITGASHHLHERPPSSTELEAAWRPWFETCLELFGPRRVLFESNFPVDKAMFSYPVLWNAFKRLSSGLSVEDRASLLGGNARRFYKLSLPRRLSAGLVTADQGETDRCRFRDRDHGEGTARGC